LRDLIIVLFILLYFVRRYTSNVIELKLSEQKTWNIGNLLYMECLCVYSLSSISGRQCEIARIPIKIIKYLKCSLIPNFQRNCWKRKVILSTYCQWSDLNVVKWSIGFLLGIKYGKYLTSAYYTSKLNNLFSFINLFF